MDARNLVGTTLDGRYDVTRLIGGGGMGCVYEATHSGTGRRVAVKVISTGDLSKDEGLIGRFQREARAAGSIETQHICQVLDTGTDSVSGLPFMVMEYMVGEDVQQLLRRVGPLAPSVALRIVAQVCMALQKAHEAGIVHRDIKPANIFLAKRDGGSILVKLLDFGIAKVAMEHATEIGDAGLTRTGTMLGSPLYMSPEQARGSKSIDHRADLWSLGVVLYESLCGRTPYHHIDALGELIIAICSEPPQPVQDVAAWVPPDAARVVFRALQADVKQRFSSATEMLEAVTATLPEGVNLEEGMLVSLSDTLRNETAKRVSVPPQLEVARANSMPPPGMTPVPNEEQGSTTGGVAAPTERVPETRPRSNATILVIGAAIGIAAAGGIAFKLVSDQNRALAQDAPVAAVVGTGEPAGETAGPQVSAIAPAVSPAPDERTVKVVVLPDDAGLKVTVDGKDATIKRGYVEVTGTLGSMHKVKLSLRAAETEEDVVISESGPQPPKVELEVKRSFGGGALPKPTTATPTAPTAPKPPGGIETKFGD